MGGAASLITIFGNAMISIGPLPTDHSHPDPTSVSKSLTNTTDLPLRVVPGLGQVQWRRLSFDTVEGVGRSGCFRRSLPISCSGRLRRIRLLLRRSISIVRGGCRGRGVEQELLVSAQTHQRMSGQ